MPPQAGASDAAKRIKELLEEKAALEQTISELKDRDTVRECRHERDRESQTKELLKQHQENLEQLKLIDKREEALKRKEEILNKAKSELEAEAAAGLEKRQQLANRVRELHAERDALVQDICAFEEEKVAFRKQKATHCDVHLLEVARMTAEDLREQLAQARRALRGSQESEQQIGLRATELEEQLGEARARIDELDQAMQQLREHMSLRDLHSSWCAAALGDEELQLGPAQQETMKVCSEAFAANAAAVSSEGRHAKKRKAVYSATQESILKLKAELMQDDLNAHRLLELTCEALLRVHCQRANAEDAGGFRLEELAKQLHAAERALLRSQKAKPVLPLLSSVAVICLLASGGARRSRAKLEELYKGVKSVHQQVGDVQRALRQLNPHLKNIYVSGKAEAADKWLPQMFEHLVGNDGLLMGLWCVSEESVEAWDLIENFQQRCRRFLVHSKGEGRSHLRLLLYWLFVDPRQVLDPKRAEDKQPWVELMSLLRQLAGEYNFS